MNMETIENEVFAFTDKFFAQSLEIINNNFNFMDTHQLIEPKENYFSVIHFLNTVMNHFTNLDYDFSKNTLKKLSRDIKNLQKLYAQQQEELDTLEDIFEKRFVKKTTLFIAMNKEVLEINKSSPLDDYDKETIRIIKQQYKQMKEIYFEKFKYDFTEQSTEILNSLKAILNSKAYYFDRLLWIEANNSNIITRSIKTIKQKNTINSKIYLTHRLSVDLPYTDDYKYLQQCLRIYK
ncbi:hypothetical protein N9X61_00290 [Sulfurimonas sp.]|nr:hypothetical protein [Sulfurimonas sp.]